jgi:hypothetical protein
MKKLILVTIFFQFFTFGVIAQNRNALDNLNIQFQSFNYSNVISIADDLLKNKNQLSEDELIDIYLIKGISHFSLGQSNLVRDSFFKILELNSNYKINSSKVSPKIITEFEKIESEYGRFISNKQSLISVKTDTLIQIDTLYIKSSTDLYSETMIRSIALPGWGHLYSGNKTKGLILTSVSALSLSSMIYFIFDADKKRSQYLNEIDTSLIDKKYNDYNKSYKIRNSLIATYALVWIYTQIDILFLSEIPFIPEIRVANIPNSLNPIPSDIQLTFRLQF